VSALVKGSIGSDPAIGVANGVPWSITAWIELPARELMHFRPNDLANREFTMNDLMGA
jgi:hypothetical protein